MLAILEYAGFSIPAEVCLLFFRTVTRVTVFDLYRANVSDEIYLLRGGRREGGERTSHCRTGDTGLEQDKKREQGRSGEKWQAAADRNTSKMALNHTWLSLADNAGRLQFRNRNIKKDDLWIVLFNFCWQTSAGAEPGRGRRDNCKVIGSRIGRDWYRQVRN